MAQRSQEPWGAARGPCYNPHIMMLHQIRHNCDDMQSGGAETETNTSRTPETTNVPTFPTFPPFSAISLTPTSVRFSSVFGSFTFSFLWSPQIFAFLAQTEMSWLTV